MNKWRKITLKKKQFLIFQTAERKITTRKIKNRKSPESRTFHCLVLCLKKCCFMYLYIFWLLQIGNWNAFPLLHLGRKISCFIFCLLSVLCHERIKLHGIVSFFFLFIVRYVFSMWFNSHFLQTGIRSPWSSHCMSIN